VHAMREMGECR